MIFLGNFLIYHWKAAPPLPISSGPARVKTSSQLLVFRFNIQPGGGFAAPISSGPARIWNSKHIKLLGVVIKALISKTPLKELVVVFFPVLF